MGIDIRLSLNTFAPEMSTARRGRGDVPYQPSGVFVALLILRVGPSFRCVQTRPAAEVARTGGRTTSAAWVSI